MVGSTLKNYPVLSLHVGGLITHTVEPVIDPESLAVIAYRLNERELDEPEAGSILMVEDVRELSSDGFIIDSTDRLVDQGDVIKLDEILDLDFNLIGLKVVTKDGKKLGKVIDYTLDTGSFSIFQIIVQRPFLDAIVDPELTINRSQIVEIDDEKITIKHAKQKIKLSKDDDKKEFIPNYVNPFRKPSYSEDDELDSSSTTSE